SANILTNNPTGGGIRPAGEMAGFPVYTSRHMPGIAASAVSTKFIIFGNMKALAFGDKGEMTVSQHESGTFGGKEIALADQRALVLKKRVALTVALGAAFVVVKTAAS
ncbi:MAG: phage major capsid protein, partial [Candidatus Pacebacteria bacterium]|nr:phage major capsid protein [Candidatus Paceibacterota bacterium]